MVASASAAAGAWDATRLELLVCFPFFSFYLFITLIFFRFPLHNDGHDDHDNEQNDSHMWLQPHQHQHPNTTLNSANPQATQCIETAMIATTAAGINEDSRHVTHQILRYVFSSHIFYNYTNEYTI